MLELNDFSGELRVRIHQGGLVEVRVEQGRGALRINGQLFSTTSTVWIPLSLERRVGEQSLMA